MDEFWVFLGILATFFRVYWYKLIFILINNNKFGFYLWSKRSSNCKLGASFSSVKSFVFELGFGFVFDLGCLLRFRPFGCLVLCSSFSSVWFSILPLPSSSESRINKPAGLVRCASLLAVRLISKSSGILKAEDFFFLSLPGVISFSVYL